jgi:hypothetical protein
LAGAFFAVLFFAGGEAAFFATAFFAGAFFAAFLGGALLLVDFFADPADEAFFATEAVTRFAAAAVLLASLPAVLLAIRRPAPA